MKRFIFIGLACMTLGCTANTKKESVTGNAPSAPVEKDYGDSARKPVLTDSVATDIRQ